MYVPGQAVPPKRRSISSIFSHQSSTARPSAAFSRPKNNLGSNLPSLSAGRASAVGRPYIASKPGNNFMNNSLINMSIVPQATPEAERLMRTIMELKPDVNLLAKFAANLDDIKILRQLDEDTTVYLLELIGSILFRPFPKINSLAIRSDTSYRPSIQNIKQILIIHRLLSNAIRQGNPTFVIIWLTPQNINSLIQLLASLDNNEMQCAEQNILTIVSLFTQIRPIILKKTAHFISEYTNGYRQFHGINAALHITEICLLSGDNNINSIQRKLYQYYILPLFTTEFLNEFYNYFSRLLMVYYGASESYLAETLHYMFLHWPKVSSVKEVVFIHHASLIAVFRGSNPIKPYVTELFNHFLNALRSENFKSCIAALNVISDPKLVFEYIQIYDTLTSNIISAVKDDLNHWSIDVREAAERAIDSIEQSAPSLNIAASHVSDNNDNSKEGWQLLSNFTGLPLYSDEMSFL